MNTEVSHLSDCQLLEETRRAVEHERGSTAQLIALLAEVDARRLYLGESCPSLFVYCTRVLRLSEHAAYGRIAAARIARQCPVVLERLADGSITLTTIELLRTHLTPDNCDELLLAARHKSRREIERLVAAISPQPDIASTIRKLPSSRAVAPAAVTMAISPATPVTAAQVTGIAAGDVAAKTASLERTDQATATSRVNWAPMPSAVRRAIVAPLAPERYLLRVTLNEPTRQKLQRAQDLLRHVAPDGDPAVVIDRALTLLLEHLERTRAATTRHPRVPVAADSGVDGDDGAGPTTRYVPAAARRAVWSRDRGQCAFVGANGRCEETAFLELHHVIPFAAGGSSTPDNLSLRCRAHNAHEATLFFGDPQQRDDHQPHSAASPNDARRHAQLGSNRACLQMDAAARTLHEHSES